MNPVTTSSPCTSSIAANQLVPSSVERNGYTWTLYGSPTGPTIKDLDWAQRLGFERPRDIRKLIKRMADAGKLGTVLCATVAQTGGRPSLEYYLTKAQALKVSAKSETEVADKILDEMIAVFLAYDSARNPHTPAALPAPTPRLSGGDDSTSLMVASLRQLLDMGLKLQTFQQDQAQLAATQASHDTRLALVEGLQRDNASAIVPISPGQAELDPIGKQRLITEHVNRYAAAMGMSNQDAWRLLYRHVDRRLGIRVYGYVLAKGETKLGRLAKLGLLDKVGKVCDTDLQIPVERQRALFADRSAYHA